MNRHRRQMIRLLQLHVSWPLASLSMSSSLDPMRPRNSASISRQESWKLPVISFLAQSWHHHHPHFFVCSEPTSIVPSCSRVCCL